ncbi:MAG TPA: hypothetical protein VH110_05135 [Candidatus Acidoferrum sp.]|nr:hypothetical protein [Candidatus Acidoferrum sp.]
MHQQFPSGLQLIGAWHLAQRVSMNTIILLTSIPGAWHPHDSNMAASHRRILAIPSEADAALELWQTECLHGMVFALRVSFVRSEQARRKDQAGDSNPAVHRDFR